MACETLRDVFSRVESADADAGVVPVENSLTGSFGETYDLLLTHELTVTGEVILSTGDPERTQPAREDFTRFYRIERAPRPPGRLNRSVFVVSLPHEPGSLFMALSSFACRKISLTKIESRPVKRDPLQYHFYLEFEGHISDWNVKAALDELKCKTSFLRVLGSFGLEE